MTKRLRTSLLAAALLGAGTSLGSIACVGDLYGDLGGRRGGRGTNGEDGEDVTGDGKADPRMTYSCTSEQRQLRGRSSSRMRRLTRDELVNTFASLLGPSIAADEGVRAKLQGLPPDRTENAGDLVAEPSTSLADVVHAVAKRGVELALSNAQWKNDQLGTCAKGATLDDACLGEAVSRFGARAYRRDLTQGEVVDLVAFAKSTGGGAAGLGYALRRMLQSPAMVFHVEQGRDAPEGGRVRLTSFEVASRVSYLTSSAPPDAELLAAARSGELDAPEGVRKHVERLFASQASHDKTRDFMRFYTHLNIVPDPTPGAAKLAGVGEGKGLGEQMRAEAVAFLDDAFWTGTYKDLMGSTKAFPKTTELAKVFGVGLDGDRPVDAPSHVGVLHRPALLASAGLRTSPILRGTHVRKLFLCQTFGQPDPAAVAAVQESLGDLSQVTNRERTEKLTQAPACAGCHQSINPVGFAFEGFDQLGKKRSVETLFDTDGNADRTHPIDTRVTGVRIEGEDALTVDGSTDLAAAMVSSFRGRACFAQRAFEYYRLAKVEDEADSCALNEAERAAHEGSLKDVVLAAIANEDIFWKALP